MNDLIIVRGAGDISTGAIHRLHRAGFSVLALESERPSAIRRRVAFSEAVYDGSATVEGVTAVRDSASARDRASAVIRFIFLMGLPPFHCVGRFGVFQLSRSCLLALFYYG